MPGLREEITIALKDTTKKGVKSVNNGLDSVGKKLNQLKDIILATFAADLLFRFVGGLIKVSDTMVELQSRLKLVTDSTEDLVKAQEALVKIAKDTGSNLEATVTIFTRLNQAILDNGGTQEETLKITRAVSESLRISGASASEAASVMLQFSQALQSGVLRGDEFNSIAENGGRLIKALTDSLGVSIGTLRDMAQQGQLTSDIVTKALLQQSEALTEESKNIPLTIARSIENLRTQWALTVGEFSEANGEIAKTLNLVAENFGAIVAVATTALKVFGAFLLLKFGSAIIKQTKGITDNIKARRQQAQEVATLQRAESALAATQAKATAAEMQATANKAKADLLEIQNNNKLAIQKAADLRTEQATLQATIANLQAQEREAKSIDQKIALANQLASAQARQLRVQQQLEASGSRLERNIQKEAKAGAVLNDALTTAENRTRDYNKEVKKNITLTEKATGVFKRFGAALFGLPGLIGLIAFEFASKFIDFEVGLRALEAQVKKLFVILSNPVEAIKGLLGLEKTGGVLNVTFRALFGTVSAFGDVLRGLGLIAPSVDISKEFQRINDEMDVALGIATKQSIEATKKQLTQDELRIQSYEKLKTAIEKAQARLAIQEKKLLDTRAELFKKQQEINAAQVQQVRDSIESQTTFLEAQLEIRKASLRDNIDNEITLNNELNKLDKEFKEEKFNRTLDFLERELKITNDNFDAEIASTDRFNQEVFDLEDKKAAEIARVNAQIAQVEKDTNQSRRDNNINFLQQTLTAITKGFDIEIDAAKQKNGARIKLEEDKAKAIRALNVEIIDLLKSDIESLTEAQQAALSRIRESSDSIKGLIERSSSFLSSLSDETLSDFEKSAKAEQKRVEISDKLREASKLNQIENAKEIKEVNETAIDDLENLIKSEKDRAKTLEVGSAAELEARNNINNAIILYKQAVDNAVTANKNLIKQNEAEKIRIMDTIKARQKSLEDYQGSINAIDDMVIKQREIELTINASKAIKVLDEIEARIARLQGQIDKNTSAADQLDPGITVIRPAQEPVGLNTGGAISGYGGGDVVPALLEPGEFVVRKEVVREKGLPFFEMLNQGIVKGFNRGGSVERLQDKYSSLLSSAKSQRRTAEIDNVIGVLENIIKSLPALEGKTRREISRIDLINGTMLSLARRGDIGAAMNIASLKERRQRLIDKPSVSEQPTVTTTSNQQAPDVGTITRSLSRNIASIGDSVSTTATPSTGEASSAVDDRVNITFLLEGNAVTGSFKDDNMLDIFINDLTENGNAV